LFVSIRYWKAPQGILRRTKIRFITAIVFSLLQIAGWMTFFIFLSTRHRS
jgi:hypothetical protein